MRKLSDALDRFCIRHPYFGIPNLMLYIIIGNAAAFFLLRLASYPASFLSLNWELIFHGQIWRLVSFLFLPSSSNPFILLISLFFFYSVGGMTEREWGTPKFTLFYLSGMVLTALAALLAFLFTGRGAMVGPYYVNMSLFLAFAIQNPDAQMLLYIIPVKAKWLAIADAVLFAVDVVAALLGGQLLMAALPLVALLNTALFSWEDLSDRLGFRMRAARHRASPRTIQFKSAARQQRRREAERGWRHRCEVCGRTDTEWPDLDFRYCSKCEGYHCFCADHIFRHEHFTR